MNQGNFFVYKIEERRTTIDNDGNGSDAVKKPLYCIPLYSFFCSGCTISTPKCKLCNVDENDNYQTNLCHTMPH